MDLNKHLVKSTVVAALGGLLFGFDTAVIAGTTHALTEQYHLSPGSLGLTVSIALWGTIVGAITAGTLGERYGRRDSLRIMSVLYLASALGCAFAWGWYSLVFFRFVGGLGIGGSSVLGPMYIAEISPAKWRGRLVGFFQINIVVGVLGAYFSNYIVGLAHFGATEWRWKLGIAAVPAFLFLVALAGIPRSPRWLAKRQQLDEARKVLELVGEESPEVELKDIVSSLHLEHKKEPLFSWKYRLPIFLAISIGVFNQLAGINAILYYLNDIFGLAGFSQVSGDRQSVAVGISLLIATLLAMSLIDRLGRKTLLLIGSVGTAASMAGIATIFFQGRHKDLLVWFLMGFIGFFGFSQGSVIWVYLSEVFPNRVRAQGQSLGSFSHWFMNAVISGIFPIMAARSGAYPFMFFASMMVLQFFVVLFVFPETKGITLEDMQRKLGID